MATACSRRHGMLQPLGSLKIGQALQSTIQYARITLSLSYDQKDWGAMQEWIFHAYSKRHSKADSASAAATPSVAEAAVSSSAVSDAANPEQVLPQCQRMQLPPRQVFALQTHHQALSCTLYLMDYSAWPIFRRMCRRRKRGPGNSATPLYKYRQACT